MTYSNPRLDFFTVFLGKTKEKVKEEFFEAGKSSYVEALAFQKEIAKTLKKYCKWIQKQEIIRVTKKGREIRTGKTYTYASARRETMIAASQLTEFLELPKKWSRQRESIVERRPRPLIASIFIETNSLIVFLRDDLTFFSI